MSKIVFDGALMRFSTEEIAERDRVEAWRASYGRTILEVDVEPQPDVPFRSELSLRALPGLGIVDGMNSAHTCSRTHGRDFTDDFLMVLHRDGVGVAKQRGEELFLDTGDAVLIHSGERGALMTPFDIRYTALRMPRAILASLVPDMDALVLRKIPTTSEPMRLLGHYLGYLRGIEGPSSPRFCQVVSNQLYDLVALALGTTRDMRHVALHRGVRAARMRALKTDIDANLVSRDLSVDALSGRHGISPRYIRGLFESENTTFRDHVAGQRLELARRLLLADQARERSISAIAFEVGFGDLSHFNHIFRRRFGATPSDVRAQGAGTSTPDGRTRRA